MNKATSNDTSDDLQRCYQEHLGLSTTKWRHYLEIYDRHFARFRGTDVHVVEIGVADGGSLQIWRRYFGEQARICGVDVNPQSIEPPASCVAGSEALAVFHYVAPATLFQRIRRQIRSLI